MRTITTHHTNECNKAITVEADDRDEENGNASHLYDITWRENDDSGMSVELPFQHGPLGEVGINGVTNEVLLAIVADRLEGFQSGKWANEYNENALAHVYDALGCLEARTKEREGRGVEGTHKL